MNTQLDKRSIQLRQRILDMLTHSRRGHIGSAFSIVEALRVLYDDVLSCRAEDPGWPDRDRFILSKGHGCLALYVLLAEKGYFDASHLNAFCSFGALLGGHPDAAVPGVEVGTGALGHGLSIGVGMALAARIDGAAHRVFVLVGDGECNEGSVWEAAMSAGKHALSRLTVLVDYNKMQSFGPTREIQDLEPFADKWRSFGFAVREVDGHDVDALRGVLGGLPLDEHKPSAIILHTVKGRGIPSIESDVSWHHKSRMQPDELAALRRELEQAP
jgi:transketolase